MTSKDTAGDPHSIRVTEDREPRERKEFGDLYITIGYKKLDPRPYGSGEMIIIYAGEEETLENGVKNASYRWIPGLPTGTDEQVRMVRIIAEASNGTGDVPFCNEVVKKAGEKTVNSIQPK